MAPTTLEVIFGSATPSPSNASVATAAGEPSREGGGHQEAVPPSPKHQPPLPPSSPSPAARQLDQGQAEVGPSTAPLREDRGLVNGPNEGPLISTTSEEETSSGVLDKQQKDSTGPHAEAGTGQDSSSTSITTTSSSTSRSPLASRAPTPVTTVQPYTEDTSSAVLEKQQEDSTEAGTGGHDDSSSLPPPQQEATAVTATSPHDEETSSAALDKQQDSTEDTTGGIGNDSSSITATITSSPPEQQATSVTTVSSQGNSKQPREGKTGHSKPGKDTQDGTRRRSGGGASQPKQHQKHHDHKQQEGAAGGGGTSSRKQPHKHKQDSIALEEKTADVLPDLFYNSFDEELKKDGLRLDRRPSKRIPEVERLIVQPVVQEQEGQGEGGSTSPTSTDGSGSCSSSSSSSSSSSNTSSRDGSPKAPSRPASPMRAGKRESEVSMSEPDLSLTSSFFAPDDPLNRKHSRLTSQLFTIHSDQRKTVTTSEGCEVEEGGEYVKDSEREEQSHSEDKGQEQQQQHHHHHHQPRKSVEETMADAAPLHGEVSRQSSKSLVGPGTGESMAVAASSANSSFKKKVTQEQGPSSGGAQGVSYAGGDDRAINTIKQGSNRDVVSTPPTAAGMLANETVSGADQPYADNMDYLRDQFRFMRIVEERNRVNRDALISHALGADPLDEDIFSQVDKAYPVPDSEGSYGGPAPGASSVDSNSVADLIQLVGNGLLLLQQDDEEASQYLNRMWDDEDLKSLASNPALEGLVTGCSERHQHLPASSNNNHHKGYTKPSPISILPQQLSVCPSPAVDAAADDGCSSPKMSGATRATPAGIAEDKASPAPPVVTHDSSSNDPGKDINLISPHVAVDVAHRPSAVVAVATEDDLSMSVPATPFNSPPPERGTNSNSNTPHQDLAQGASKSRQQPHPLKHQQQVGTGGGPDQDGTQAWQNQTGGAQDQGYATKRDGGYSTKRSTSTMDAGRDTSGSSLESRRHAVTANLRQKEKVFRAYIRQRLIVTWTKCKWIPRLEVLTKAFELSRFEKMVLVLFVAKHFSKVYLGLGSSSSSLLLGFRDSSGSGNDGGTTTTATIQDLSRSFLPRLTDQIVAPFKYFSPSSPLVRESIITVLHTPPSSSAASSTVTGTNRLHPMLQRVAINPSIAEHLLDTASMHPGARHLDRHLHAQDEGVHEPNTPLHAVILPPKTREKIESAVKNLGLYLELRRRPPAPNSVMCASTTSSRLGGGCGTIFLFTGKPGSGKRLLAQAVATELGKKVVWSGRSGRPHYKDLFMQSKMHDAVLVAHVQGISVPGSGGGSGSQSASTHTPGYDEGEEPLVGLLRSALEGGYNSDWGSFEEEMERHSDLVILLAQSASLLPKALRRWVSLLVELDEQPDHILRRQLWEVMRPSHFTLAEDVDLDELAMKWPFNAGLIKSSWVMAQLFAVLRDGQAPHITQADLHKAARNQLDEKLRLEAPGSERSNSLLGGDYTGPTGGGLDIAVLNSSVRENLSMIVNNAKACDVVYGQWGFRPDHAAATGVRALFWGPPGTGKTHAAHCVSYELGKTLKVANSAQLTSKFVGDTSKNLQKLFREAKDSGSVLLFDEAEGLFSERKDHSEKHDLEEVNLLLQLVESFDGVMIATTNRPELIDVAFRRRFDTWVEFSEPSDKERADLWRLLFPPQAPLAKDVDFGLLARRYPMSGGHIKSAVRRAAMRAALRPTKEQVIQMEDLLCAAAEEMKKKEGGNSQSNEATSHLYA